MTEMTTARTTLPVEAPLAPGARIVVRDAEWLVRRVDATPSGGQAVSCVGLSELVQEKEATFLTEVEEDIKVLRPEETHLVPDKSRGYEDSLVYLESLLRQSPPTDERTAGERSSATIGADSR